MAGESCPLAWSLPAARRGASRGTSGNKCGPLSQELSSKKLLCICGKDPDSLPLSPTAPGSGSGTPAQGCFVSCGLGIAFKRGATPRSYCPHSRPSFLIYEKGPMLTFSIRSVTTLGVNIALVRVCRMAWHWLWAA